MIQHISIPLIYVNLRERLCNYGFILKLWSLIGAEADWKEKGIQKMRGLSDIELESVYGAGKCGGGSNKHGSHKGSKKHGSKRGSGCGGGSHGHHGGSNSGCGGGWGGGGWGGNNGCGGGWSVWSVGC